MLSRLLANQERPEAAEAGLESGRTRDSSGVRVPDFRDLFAHAHFLRARTELPGESLFQSPSFCAREKAEAAPSLPKRHHTKKAKTIPEQEEDADSSSEPSSCSVSEDSALPSSLPQTRYSSFSSAPDESSDSTSSSEESDNRSEEVVVTVGGPKKPDFNDNTGAQSLRARLDKLFPRLEESNKMLAAGNYGLMEDVDEGERCIKRDLGLGVLEQKNGEDDTSSESKSSDDEGRDPELPSEVLKRRSLDRESNVMRKLMGRPKGKRKVGRMRY